MKELFVVNNSNVPSQVMIRLLESLNSTARAIEEKVNLADGCGIKWHMLIMRSSGRETYYGYCSVSMGFHVDLNIEESATSSRIVFVPITLVREIKIFTSGGCHWYDRDAELNEISIALGKGKLNGHSYQANKFPELTMVK